MLTSYDLYEYDSVGNLTKLIMYDSYLEWIEDGEIGLSETIIMEYDNHKNKIFEKILSSYENILLEETSFIYDSKRNIVRIEKYDPQKDLRFSCVSTYDKNNNRITGECSNSPDKEIFKYEYDSMENWTLRLIKVNNSEYQIEGKREIKYY